MLFKVVFGWIFAFFPEFPQYPHAFFIILCGIHIHIFFRIGIMSKWNLYFPRDIHIFSKNMYIFPRICQISFSYAYIYHESNYFLWRDMHVLLCRCIFPCGYSYISMYMKISLIDQKYLFFYSINFHLMSAELSIECFNSLKNYNYFLL